MSGPPYLSDYFPDPNICPTEFDFAQTIISQYANSPILTQLITDFFQYIDPTTNFNAFYDLIWNVDTAQGHGLDVWGRIVGVSRVIPIVNDDTFFGFKEAVSGEPFGQAPFFAGSSVTDNFSLSDTAFRVLIFAKALSNISDGSSASINQILLNLFPDRGNAYVRDNHDMTITYVFEFDLTSVEESIVNFSGALPKPTGVSYDVETPP